ncbi:hypothetical protein [Agromyces ramosus]|nr:hypothetical protein [Agromyces ramosus]
MVEHDRAWALSAQRELRVLLNEWDPLGVYVPAGPGDEEWLPQDEYDCIRDPLLSRLLRGDSKAEVAQFLRHELDEHFGVPTRLVTTELVDKVAGWWETVR